MIAATVHEITKVIVKHDNAGLIEPMLGSIEAFTVRTKQRGSLLKMKPDFEKLGYNVGRITKTEELQYQYSAAVFKR